MSDLPGFREFLERANDFDIDRLKQRLRAHGQEPVTSFFATIHRQSEARPNGFTDDDLDDIHSKLSESDVQRWIEQLEELEAAKAAGGQPGSGGGLQS